MSKMKFSNYQAKQSRIVEGVCVPISHGVGNYDELLREAVRVALRMDMDPARDDWDDLYDRIRRLMAAYIASPEGEGGRYMHIDDAPRGLRRGCHPQGNPERAGNALKHRRYTADAIARRRRIRTCYSPPAGSGS